MILTAEQAKAWPTMTEAEREPVYIAWSEADPDLRSIEYALEDLSTTVWAAGFLQDIEWQAWRMLTDGVPSDETFIYGTRAEVVSAIEELKTLTIDQGRYIVYDDHDSIIGHLVTLDEWHQIVAERTAAGQGN